MDRDLALRIAATVDDGITVEQAKRIVGEFLAQLARCPVCDGSGVTTFGQDVEVDVRTHANRRVTDADRFISAGTTGSCPRCGSVDPEASGQGDPAWVAWHCVAGDDDQQCERDRQSDRAEQRDGHTGCGWRLMLPYETGSRS